MSDSRPWDDVPRTDTPFLNLLRRLPPTAPPTNYVQVFHTPFNAGDPKDLRSWRFCSYCGRERGNRYTCDGCGAPSVLVNARDLPGEIPYSLEWWRERIAREAAEPGVYVEFEAGPYRVPNFGGWPAWPPL